MSQNRFALAAWIREFTHALAADPDAILDHLSHEPPANEVRLIYSPRQKEADSLVPKKPQPLSRGSDSQDSHPAQAVAEKKTEDSSVPEKKPVLEEPSATAPPQQMEYPANFRCTLCADRMYPVRRFYRKGRLPVLVAYHSGGFLQGPPKRDLSDRFIFGSAEEDDLFFRMIGALGKKPEDFHFQEYVACHFNPERSIDEDWTRRGENCLNHLKDTIERENIRLLLLTGPAAIILLSEDVAKKHSVSGEALPLPLGPGGQSIPALPMRSPAALLALEQKRKKARSLGDESAYQRLLSKEKEIKEQILSSLRRAFSDGAF